MFAAQFPAYADTGSSKGPALPRWADEDLGSVIYNYTDDQRKKDEKIYYRINEDGVITGMEILAQAANEGLAAAMYEGMLELHPDKIDPNKSPSQLKLEYRQRLIDRRLAILILNRILDHEAMKHKLEPDVPDARVNYIVRSILTQSAAETGRIKSHTSLVPRADWVMDKAKVPSDPAPTTCHQVTALDEKGELKTVRVLDEDPSSRSSVEMFAWFKERVGDNQLSFETDWTYAEDLGLAFDHDHLHDKPDLGWPMEPKLGFHKVKNKDTDIDELKREPLANPAELVEIGDKDHPGKKVNIGKGCRPIAQEQRVTMAFEKFPATLQEFRESIRQQLQPIYMAQMRSQVWKKIAADRNPLAPFQAGLVSTDQLNQMYAALKDSPAIQIPRLTASFNEVSASGARASEFKARYLALLDAGEAAHDDEFRKKVDPASSGFIVALQAWVERIAALRSSIQSEAYRAAVLEFAADITAGRLRASSTDRTLTRTAGEEYGKSASFADQEESSAFNPDFAGGRLIPRMAGIGSDSSIKIMTMTHLKSDPRYQPQDASWIQAFLRRQVEGRVYGKIFRKLAFDLFKLNRFEFSHNFCEEEGWPCSYADDSRVAPRLLAEALFPETLYPGQKLPTFLQQSDGNGGMKDAEDVPGQPPQPRYSSTLNHEEYFDRVQEISISNLDRVFSAPNTHVDIAIRFHNY